MTLVKFNVTIAVEKSNLPLLKAGDALAAVINAWNGSEEFVKIPPSSYNEKSRTIADNARKFVSVIHEPRKQLAQVQRSAAATVA